MTCWDELKSNMTGNMCKWLDFIESWCDGKARYTREVGFPYRKMTTDLDRTFRQLLFFSAEMHNDTYMTVYSFRKMREIAKPSNPQRKHIPDYSTAFINKVYWELDFDHKKGGNLEDAYNDWTKMCDYFDGKCRGYFTTNRGFHIYVDLVTSITKQQLIDYTTFIIDGLGIQTADRGFIGDTARIMRIPYFPHSKTKRFILPVTRNMSFQYMLENSKTCYIPEVIKKQPISIPPEVFEKLEAKRIADTTNTKKVGEGEKKVENDSGLQQVVEKRGNTITVTLGERSQISGEP